MLILSRARLILANANLCVVLDREGVPRLRAIMNRDSEGKGAHLWRFEATELHQDAELGSGHYSDGHGTTGWVCYLLGLPSA